MHEKEKKSLETMDGEEPKPCKKEKVIEEPEVDELPITLPPSAVVSSGPKASTSPSKTTNQAKERTDAPILSREKIDDWEKVSDVYNGSETENYKWSQTITDIDVKVFLPAGTTARDLKVDMQSEHLRVALSRPTTRVIK